MTNDNGGESERLVGNAGSRPVDIQQSGRKTGQMAPADTDLSGKNESAMLTIGEVSRLLNVKPHILRYWEAQFKQLSPLKRAGRRRYYRTDDVELLRLIDRMINRDGFSIKGARKYLHKMQGKPRPDEPYLPEFGRSHTDPRNATGSGQGAGTDGSGAGETADGSELSQACYERLQDIYTDLKMALDLAEG